MDYLYDLKYTYITLFSVRVMLMERRKREREGEREGVRGKYASGKKEGYVDSQIFA